MLKPTASISGLLLCILLFERASALGPLTVRGRQHIEGLDKYLDSHPQLRSNPFVKDLFIHNITMAEIRHESTSGCKFEWNTHGTFCDEEKLLNFSKSDQSKIQASVKTVLEELSKISQLLLAVEGEIKQENKTNPKKIAFYREWVNPVHQEFVKMVESFSSREYSGRQSFNKCWDTMAKIRSNSLCSICSARSEVFFREEKALVSEKKCDKVMEDCIPSFKEIFSFLTNLELFLEKLGEFKSMKGTVEERELENVIQKLTLFKAYLSQNQILKAIQNYFNGHADGFKSYSFKVATSNLCQKLLRVFDMPFIVLIERCLFAPARFVLGGSVRIISRPPPP